MIPLTPLRKRAALGVLPAPRLRRLLDDLGIEAADRKSKEGLTGALEEHFLGVLVQLKRDELKAMCEALGLDASGKAKDELMERIVGDVPPPAPAPGIASTEAPSPAGGSRRDAMSEKALRADRPVPGKQRSNGRAAAQLRLALPAEPVPPRPAERTDGEDPDATALAGLGSHLWEAANILRGSPVDRTDWKSYVLPLLFFKRVCDVWDEEHAAMLAEYGTDYPDEHRFQIPEGCHWRDVRGTAKNVGAALKNAMRGVESENQKHLYGVFGDAQWSNKERLPDDLLKDLVEHFSALSLGNQRVASDLMGDAYEYLIKKFADATNKKAGEFYTPRSVVRLMVDMLDPKEGETIYDPACGTGGMLLAAVEHVRERGGDPRTFFGKLYAQEKNLTTASVARMNLFLHGIEDFQVERGDTLRNPVFKDPVTGGLARFDVVIANPPFSLEQWGREVWESDPWGRAFAGLPPESNGDFAWVQHMVNSMTSRVGRAAVILPIGATIRRGVEQQIRKHLVERDLVESVVGLPSDLFYGTVVEAVILVLRSKKPTRTAGTVFFVDATDRCTHRRSLVTLDAQHVHRIRDLVAAREPVQGRCAVATAGEIVDRDWALAPKVHIEPTIGTSADCLAAAIADFRQKLDKSREADARVRKVLSTLVGDA
jgi:type I restriction enzyme M protein